MVCVQQAEAFQAQHDALQKQLTQPERIMTVCEVCGVFINSTDNEQRRQVGPTLGVRTWGVPVLMGTASCLCCACAACPAPALCTRKLHVTCIVHVHSACLVPAVCPHLQPASCACTMHSWHAQLCNLLHILRHYLCRRHLCPAATLRHSAPSVLHCHCCACLEYVLFPFPCGRTTWRASSTWVGRPFVISTLSWRRSMRGRRCCQDRR